MRVGIVIDDLDRRRGGMSEWCWQFVARWPAADVNYTSYRKGLARKPCRGRSCGT